MVEIPKIKYKEPPEEENVNKGLKRWITPKEEADAHEREEKIAAKEEAKREKG